MEIIHAVALLQTIIELTDAGFIIGNLAGIFDGKEPMDCDGLLYEKLYREVVTKNPLLEQIEEAVLLAAEKEFFTADDTKALTEQAVHAVRDYLASGPCQPEICISD